MKELSIFDRSILSVITAYGVVFRARERSTSQIVALKQVRTSLEERHNGLPITALREMSILRSLRHENIVNVLEVAVEELAMDEIYMVMEYCEQVGDPTPRVSTYGFREVWAHLVGLLLLHNGGLASYSEIVGLGNHAR